MAKRQKVASTRAEKIRAQGKQNPNKTVKPPLTSSATRKQNKVRVPVTRRSTSTMPVINRKRNQVHVPLKKKGAELQLPAFPRLRLGWRLISGAVFALSLAMVISFSSLSAFQVSSIDLRGAQRLDAGLVLEQVDIIGEGIIKVQPEETAEKIQALFPSLSSVRVSVGIPASVTLRVTERQPLILWQGDSDSLWIDAEGVMFPIMGEAEVTMTVMAKSTPPAAAIAEEDEPGALEEETTQADENEDVISIAGMPPQKYPRTTPEFIQGILSLKNYIPEGSSLQYDPQFGLGWQDTQGWLVYFGKDVQNIDLKLAEYQTILAALRSENITPALISLEFLHAPFYRLE